MFQDTPKEAQRYRRRGLFLHGVLILIQAPARTLYLRLVTTQSPWVHLKNLPIIVFICSSILRLHSQGYIVANGVTYAGNTPGLGTEIHVLQNPTNGDYTGFTLPPRIGNRFLFNPLLDEGVRTFLVSSNDPISLQPIMANSYSELTYPNTYVLANGSTFYLGFYTGNSFPQNGIYSDPLFGWGRFVNNNGVIQLLDSALEYQGGGIYAGTQNIIPIPEPSAIALTAFGLLTLAFCRWRRS